MLPVMFTCIWYGVPRENPDPKLLRELDWPGLVYAGLGFSLLYAGLDQGNRLDWVQNGVVSGLLHFGQPVDGRVCVSQRAMDAAAIREHSTSSWAKICRALLAAAGRLSLHHSFDRLHYPDVSANRAEFP